MSEKNGRPYRTASTQESRYIGVAAVFAAAVMY